MNMNALCKVSLLAGAIILIAAGADAHEPLQDQTFDTVCRNHVTAFNYMEAENKRQFFELDVCMSFYKKFGFSPKATLYELETVGDLTSYFAAFPNGTHAIVVK